MEQPRAEPCTWSVRILHVPEPTMYVGRLNVTARERYVSVLVLTRLARWMIRHVLMLVMLIVQVAMRVRQRLVRMEVLVSLGEV